MFVLFNTYSGKITRRIVALLILASMVIQIVTKNLVYAFMLEQ